MSSSSRRDFIKLISAGATGIALSNAGAVLAESKKRKSFVFTQIKYRGGNYLPYPSSARTMMRSMLMRTSVDVGLDRKDIEPSDPKLFYHPFLYITGKDAFEPFPKKTIPRLRRFLDGGGTMLVDDAAALDGGPFDLSVRRELSKIYPDIKIKRLPDDHTVFRSYYMLDRLGGRVLTRPYLEGITVGKRTPVIICQNDLGGAWATDPLGKWLLQCEPGGESQREYAFRVGVNVILYALTINYKKDAIHVEEILKRRRFR